MSATLAITALIIIYQIILGIRFICLSDSIYSRDKEFAVAGRYLVGFGGMILMVMIIGLFFPAHHHSP